MRPFLPRWIPLLSIAFVLGSTACSSDSGEDAPADTGVVATDSGAAPEPDAGVVDAGVETGGMDASATDAAPVDAGLADAGAADTGEPTGDAGLETSCDDDFFPSNACGGSVVGTTWRVVDACGDEGDDSLSAIRDTCFNQTGDPTAFEATITSVVSSTGTFAMGVSAATDWEMDIEDELTVTLTVQDSCLSGLSLACESDFEDFLTGTYPDATCALQAAGCVCSLTANAVESDASGSDFDVAATQFSLTGVNLRTFDYCVDRGVLRFRDVAGGRTYVLVED